ncbi:MAG: anti-sigma factor [Gammaproteobacteria bacterium]|nr:anti-sigma factor [Gammaproteobacteria bacterium]
MTSNSKPITDGHLHAYVDGQLSAAQCAEVEAYLNANPHKARRVEQYRMLTQQLHDKFDASMDEPLPAAVLALGQDQAPAPSPTLCWGRIAAALAWLAVGGSAGWMLHSGVDRPQQAVIASAQQHAYDAHRFYVREGRHVVEVPAADKDHLMKWLSGRLGTQVGPADLTSAGYQLLGGRLLPAGDYASGIYMYENAQHERITQYISAEPGVRGVDASQCETRAALNVCVWNKDALTFVLVGAAPLAELQTLAQHVREQSMRTAP